MLAIDKKKILFKITEERRYKAFVLLKCVNNFVHDCGLLKAR